MSEEMEYDEEDLPASICSLANALSNLSDIDPALLSQVRQRKLARMKRLIFDSLCWYAECLPQPEEGEEVN